MQWGTTKGKRVLSALLKMGWQIKNGNGGSHMILAKVGFAPYSFSFGHNEEIGPPMLSKIARKTGLTPDLL